MRKPVPNPKPPTNAIALEPEDVERLRAFVQSVGPKAACEKLDVSEYVLSRAMNGWRTSPLMAGYLRDCLARMVPGVERTGT